MKAAEINKKQAAAEAASLRKALATTNEIGRASSAAAGAAVQAIFASKVQTRARGD